MRRMKKMMVVPMMIATMALTTAAARGYDKPGVNKAEPLETEGELTQLAEHIEPLMKLTLVEGKLRLDTTGASDEKKKQEQQQEQQKNAQQGKARIQIQGGGRIQIGGVIGGRIGGNMSDYEQTFLKLQQAAGGNSQGMMLSSNIRRLSFASGKLQGSLVVRDKANHLTLQELDGPKRTLEMTDDPDGTTRVILAHPQGDMIMLMQAAGGRFTVMAVRRGQPQVTTADSFAAWYKQNRALADEALFPLLSKAGVGAPMTQYSPLIRKTVVSMLQPLDKATKEKAEQLVAQLDSDDYQTREKATQELIKHYMTMRPVIAEHSKKTDLSTEAKARLAQVKAEGEDPRQLKAMKVVEAMKLTDDVDYLKEIAQAVDADGREVIEQHIKSLQAKDKTSDAQ